MKKLSILLFLLIICTINAQDENAEMEAWMEAMTPGDMHKMLAEHVGGWTTSTKFWMSPDTEPMISEGAATAEMIYGGRYIKMDHTGTTMGMPFTGMSIEGYDNVKKKFVNIWIDNLGTGIARSEGTYDAEKKTITYEGVMSDPMVNGDIKFKSVFEKISSDKIIYTMYMNMDGQEVKGMEMTYLRK